MKPGRIALLAVAAAAVALSLFNASWTASRPAGALVLIAHRGVAQPFDRATAGPCSARNIAGTDHRFIENTIFSMQNAIAFGARGLALDVRASADGQAMIFRDADLACRTNGTGRVADHPLSYLRNLDIGYGYSPDGGRTFPLRGRGVGGMPIAEEVLQAFRIETLIFTLSEPRDAEALIAAFGRAGVAIGPRIGFAGSPAALGRLRQLTRAGWTLDPAASDSCLSGYRAWGWLGIVPASCNGATIVIPRRGEWTLWGWPYRFFSRLAGANARLFIEGDPPRDGEGGQPQAGGGGPARHEAELVGLERPEQLGEVPHDYHGLLLIEDMYDVGRALRR
jgi:glycerophosphoryl diester phosphodiesterase